LRCLEGCENLEDLKEATGDWKEVGDAPMEFWRLGLSLSLAEISRAVAILVVAVLLEEISLGGEVFLTEMEVVLKSAGVGAVLLSGSMTADGSLGVLPVGVRSSAVDCVLAESGAEESAAGGG
jgi:hypothetical protein